MKKLFLCTTLLTALSACSTQEKAPIQDETEITPTFINEYPTRDRVDYVLNCVAQHGGLTYITQYACGCKIDKIAEKLSFTEFEAATTFGFMRKTPGESGGVFRDPKESKSLRQRLKEADAYAERMCFVK